MISASLVKELREKTGAGMLDCKKALEANNGNIDAYGICDIHPYNSNITSIQNDNKKVSH